MDDKKLYMINKRSYYSESNEYKESQRILEVYKNLRENMSLTDDSFEDILLSDVSIEFLNKHIDDLTIYINDITVNKKWKPWSEAWLYIYSSELLRRRTEKINKIKEKIAYYNNL